MQPPTPEIQAPEGWEREEEKRTVASVSVSVFSFDCVSNGVVYKNALDGDTRGFVFGSRVGFDPEPPGLAVRAILRAVGENIWSGVEDSMEERGLSSLKTEGERRIEIRGGRKKVRLKRYSAVSEGEDRTTVWISIWAQGSYICVAGGAYPDSEEVNLKQTVMDAIESFE